MTYQIIDSIAKPNIIGRRWVSIDIQNELCHTLYDNYQQILVLLNHNTFESGHRVLDIADIHHLLADKKITFFEWLNSIGNQSLPTKEGDLSLNDRTAKYVDGWRSHFSIQPGRIGYHPDAPLSRSEKWDLRLTRENTNYFELQKRTLVTVNGLLHQTSGTGHGLYVQDGAWQSEKTQLGMIDLSPIGTYEQINLTSDMLYKPHPDSQSFQFAYLNIGKDLSNKFILLSIGGYLHAYDSFYSMIGPGLIKFDFNRYPIIQRYYESKDLINLSSLPLSEFPGSESKRLTEQLLRSEAYIEALINLPQTFAIVLDTPDLYIDRIPLQKSGLPGVFISHQEPTAPLLTQRGKLKEYWSRPDHGRWVVNVESNLVPNYQFEHSGYENELTVVNHKTPHKPYYYDRGFWLEIGRQR